ncbi:Zinc finger B-box domain-containing protein 1 [Clonorchis sinensis]|uniref:Zinc finger B-box domain-containing protein 1 n=1 Tax=Clonorchis sinensis TaxID=79923 RepID=A0A8T1MGQ1_CLOSI|nr:Zinc finger B-box domain-containing protein 1 [Clonorchis sinensis]
MRKIERKSALKKKQDENEQLESETKRMEERLSMLKSVLNTELKKLPTNNGSSEYIWAGSIPKERSTSAVKVNRIFNLERVKLTTLQREEQSFQPVSDDVYKNIVNKLTNECSGDLRSDASNKVHIQQIKCGQCEVKCAAVSCQECNEDYCAKCFARFHIKGAMKRHHSLPISCYSTRPTRTTSLENKLFNNQLNRDVPCDGRTPSNSDYLEPGKETCDFQAQSRSPITQVTCVAQTESQYADILGGRPTVSTTSRGTSSERPPSPKITFSPSLSYAERLMLRKHRRSKTPPMLTKDAKYHASAISPSKNDGTGDKSDLDVTWSQVDFNQLHTLATAPLKMEDLAHLCHVDDLETMENVVSSDPLSAECGSPKAANQKNAALDCELHSTQNTPSENHAELNQQGDFESGDTVSKYVAPNLDITAVQEPKPVTCWQLKASLQKPPELIQSELKTIELIKRHLNKLTTTEHSLLDSVDDQPT